MTVRGHPAGVLSRCSFPPPERGPVALAVSGGADSMALLVLAAEAGLFGTVVHVDHGLRPGAAAEAALVESAAVERGFRFDCRRIAVEPGADLEARARRARYAVLPPGVLVGHTMDDQAETVLLNVLRGAALDGLAGMRAGSKAPEPRVVRPLLSLRRAETEEICLTAGVRWIDDPTNSESRFRRNRVRRELIPLLCDIAQRDVVPVLARQADLVADDAALLEDLAARLDPTDVRALREAPLPLARRSLRRWLRRSDPAGECHPPSRADIERVFEVVSGGAVACELAGGRRVARRAGRLHLLRAGAP